MNALKLQIGTTSQLHGVGNVSREAHDHRSVPPPYIHNVLGSYLRWEAFVLYQLRSFHYSSLGGVFRSILASLAALSLVRKI